MLVQPPFPTRLSGFICRILAVLVLTAFFNQPTAGQSADDLKRDRNRGVVMLALMKDYIKEFYYDPNYHGMDVDKRFSAAEEKVKQATSLSQILGIAAQALADLNDSHTFFIPPSRPVDVDYGWKMQMVGDACYVIAVEPGSDAEVQRLNAGDEVISLDGFRPTRDNIWKMEYSYNVLRPQPGKRIVVRTPDGQERELALKAKVEKRSRQINPEEWFNEISEDREDEKKLPRYYELGDEVLIWKLRHFDLSDSKIEDTMKKARKHKALILDLRGNGGGQELALQKLVGSFFDHDVVVGEMKRRKESKPLKAKTRGGEKVFAGKLAVLIDSKSGSAAELFARTVQLEKRGTIIGDRSAGAVMRSRFRPGALGDMSNGNMIFYGASVTDADIIMSDGNGLEHVGVTPDETILPTAADLQAKRDPALTHAASLVGVELTPEKAGTLFPPEKERW